MRRPPTTVRRLTRTPSPRGAAPVKKPHPSTAHLLVPATDSSHRDELIGGPDSWLDTSAVFSPSVLSLHPSVPPCPGAVAYGVGYGTLTAFLSQDGVDRHGATVELGYDGYVGFPEGPYASFEDGTWRF